MHTILTSILTQVVCGPDGGSPNLDSLHNPRGPIAMDLFTIFEFALPRRIAGHNRIPYLSDLFPSLAIGPHPALDRYLLTIPHDTLATLTHSRDHASPACTSLAHLVHLQKDAHAFPLVQFAGKIRQDVDMFPRLLVVAYFPAFRMTHFSTLKRNIRESRMRKRVSRVWLGFLGARVDVVNPLPMTWRTHGATTDAPVKLGVRRRRRGGLD